MCVGVYVSVYTCMCMYVCLCACMFGPVSLFYSISTFVGYLMPKVILVQKTLVVLFNP